MPSIIIMIIYLFRYQIFIMKELPGIGPKAIEKLEWEIKATAYF